MCGIFGSVGRQVFSPDLIVDGLKRLEYRGYDSWGVATTSPQRPISLHKAVGKISRSGGVERLMEHGSAAIGHTRWATHGKPDTTNAHPHLSRDGRIAVVHNGIIENYRELRSLLEEEGFHFRSQTDTEVVPMLLEREMHRGRSLKQALPIVLGELKGAFGLAIVHAELPERIFAVRMGSPMVLGVGESRMFLSSDANALAPLTGKVIYLDDREWAELTPEGAETYDFRSVATLKEVQEFEAEKVCHELGPYRHYMQKEIHEQPAAIANCLGGRLDHGEATIKLAGLEELVGRKRPERIKIIACGSSWHAGLMGRHYFEELARIPCEVEYASEFRYRNAVIEPKTMVIAISQSGETADTLAALRESKRRGALPLGIVNVVASSIARECGRGVYLHAGPEFGVAATKSFTNQVVSLLMLAVHFARASGLSLRQGLALIDAIESLPALASETLRKDAEIESIAREYVDSDNFLYVGRGLEYPVALEGALKLKEVSYIHAEGLAAAELKHGPIALVAPETPTVVVATQTFLLDKIASNVQEIKARGGRIIAVIGEECETIRDLADHVVTVPEAHDLISPILATIPTQILAYHLAVMRDCDVDQPRNLAKSVTVE
jgi:glucosamine--fructose-6-phosphate aminotransferase (isomerizing)